MIIVVVRAVGHIPVLKFYKDVLPRAIVKFCATQEQSVQIASAGRSVLAEGGSHERDVELDVEGIGYPVKHAVCI